MLETIMNMTCTALAIGTLSILAADSALAQGIARPKTGLHQDMMPDPGWEPSPGDRVQISREWAPACVNMKSYDRLKDSIKADDSIGVEKLIQSSGIAKLPKGVNVLILKGYRPDRSHSGPRVFSGAADFVRSAQESILSGEDIDFGTLPVEVRILDGNLAGQTRLIPEEFLARLVPRPAPKGFYLKVPGAQAYQFQPFTFSKRVTGSNGRTISASSLLAMGLKAEHTNGLTEAISCYLLINRSHPETQEAKTASERLTALGFWRALNGDLRVDPARRQDRPDQRHPVQAKAPTPKATRAASSLRSAQNLEKSGKSDGAVGFYRQVIKDFPESPEAKLAAQRLKELGKE